MKMKCKKVVILLMISVLFCSCKEETPVDSWEAVVGMGHCYMNEGVIGANDHILRFYDVQSGQDVALCAKPNCEHLGASSTNPSPECNAYLGSYPDMAAIVGGQLYCVIQEEFTWDKPEGLFQKYLYRAEVDGTNRKEIAKFSDAQVSATADYGEGYFVYTHGGRRGEYFRTVSGRDISGRFKRGEDRADCCLRRIPGIYTECDGV